MNNLNPVIAEALAPFVPMPAVELSGGFIDWGWCNGFGVAKMELFQAERKRHDKEMRDGIGEHQAKYVPGHNVEGFACSCGFAWKMDYSG